MAYENNPEKKKDNKKMAYISNPDKFKNASKRSYVQNSKNNKLTVHYLKTRHS